MSYFDSIYADTLLPPRAVSVYMYLKDRSNSAGSCWPGIKTIARDMNLSRSTVKRALLEDGALRRSWLAAHQGELTQTLRRVRQDRHHPPPAGGRPQGGHPARPVLRDDPQL